MELEYLKKLVEISKDRLYKHIESDEYVSPDMLDDALAVINRQSEYIVSLENNIEMNKCE